MTGMEIAAVAGTAFSVGDIMLVAGAAASVMGSMQQANYQKQQAEYNAAVARNQAIAHRQAAEAQAKRSDREQRLRAGSQRARFAASGVTLEGTPLDLMTDTEIEAQLERNMIIYNGEIGATNSLAQAGAFDNEAKNANIGVGLASVTTLLTAGSKIGTQKAANDAGEVLGAAG